MRAWKMKILFYGISLIVFHADILRDLSRAFMGNDEPLRASTRCNISR